MVRVPNQVKMPAVCERVRLPVGGRTFIILGQKFTFLRASLDQLKTVGIFHWKNFGGPMCQPGVPDILGIWQGRMLGIEIKAPNGRVSEHQQRFIDSINREGGLAFVARSIDDVIDGLDIRDRLIL